MLNLFMSSGNFPPSTKWRKYNIFWWFKFIIWGLWEVEHDLETCQRPRSTQILILWAFQGSKYWKWSFKEYCAFVILSFRPWTKIAGQHEQVYGPIKNLPIIFVKFCTFFRNKSTHNLMIFSIAIYHYLNLKMKHTVDNGSSDICFSITISKWNS